MAGITAITFTAIKSFGMNFGLNRPKSPLYLNIKQGGEDQDDASCIDHILLMMTIYNVTCYTVVQSGFNNLQWTGLSNYGYWQL